MSNKTDHTNAKAQALKDALAKSQSTATQVHQTLGDAQTAETGLRIKAADTAKALQTLSDSIITEEKALATHKVNLAKAEASRAKDKDAKVAVAKQAVTTSETLLQGLKDKKPELEKAASDAAEELATATTTISTLHSMATAADGAVAQAQQNVDALAPVPATTFADLQAQISAMQDEMRRNKSLTDQALEDGGVQTLSRVPEVDKNDVSTLTPEMKRYFLRMRSITRNASSQLVFGNAEFLAFVKGRCEVIKLSMAQWMVPILIIFMSDPSLKQVFELLVSWAHTYSVGAPLPIQPGMVAVSNMLHLLGAMYTRYWVSSNGCSWTMLELSQDAHLRCVDPLIIVSHQGELKNICGRHPMKAMFEGLGCPFPEQAPSLAAMMAMATGNAVTLPPAALAPPPPPPPPPSFATPAPTPAPAAGTSDQLTAMGAQVGELTKLVQRLSSTVGQMKRPRENDVVQDAKAKMLAKLKLPDIQCGTCGGYGHLTSNCVPAAQATCKGNCMRCGGAKHIATVCTSALK